jgi:hypothetical protein
MGDLAPFLMAVLKVGFSTYFFLSQTVEGGFLIRVVEGIIVKS